MTLCAVLGVGNPRKVVMQSGRVQENRVAGPSKTVKLVKRYLKSSPPPRPFPPPASLLTPESQTVSILAPNESTLRPTGYDQKRVSCAHNHITL